MAGQVKLTKTERSRQRGILKKSLKMLPLFQAMEKQLMVTIQNIEEDISRIREAIRNNEAEAQKWVPVAGDDWADIRSFVTVREVITVPVDIAGVRVQQFKKIDFDIASVADSTPLWVDDALIWVQDQLQLLAEIECLEKQIVLLDDELSDTRSGVKLFENRLIPAAKKIIKRITDKFQDDERLAIGTAKVMKTKKEEVLI